MVGSPEYMAVEVLDGQGYTHTADHWSLGVILYELLLGITPFVSDTVVQVFQNIVDWDNVLIRNPAGSLNEEADVEISDLAWDLISKLICIKEKRIGTNGIDDIKNHPFFKGIQWDKIREIEPPFVPQLEDELDTSYFTEDDEPKSIDELVEACSQGDRCKLFSTAKNKKQDNVNKYIFAGFSFKHYNVAGARDKKK